MKQINSNNIILIVCCLHFSNLKYILTIQSNVVRIVEDCAWDKKWSLKVETGQVIAISLGKLKEKSNKWCLYTNSMEHNGVSIVWNHSNGEKFPPIFENAIKYQPWKNCAYIVIYCTYRAKYLISIWWNAKYVGSK